ncbi:hypothetical protein [Methylocaldum gracile]|jgi:hypothetical protein|uniref:hypothetical protein n=1 Tax=Methylocaldum sp. 0917 TaxID=2485163 RepID=UPI00105FAD13
MSRVPYDQLAKSQISWPFWDTDDPKLIVDADFRTFDLASLPAGWTRRGSGTGDLIDPDMGYKMLNGRTLQFDLTTSYGGRPAGSTLYDAASDHSEGSIVFEVERKGFAQLPRKRDNTAFYDSNGDDIDLVGLRVAAAFGSENQEGWSVYFASDWTSTGWNCALPQFRVNSVTSFSGGLTSHLNGFPDSGADPDFAEIVFSWKTVGVTGAQLTYHWAWYDGMLVSNPGSAVGVITPTTMGTTGLASANFFRRLAVGGSQLDTPGRPFCSANYRYHMRRLQLSQRYIEPRQGSLRIAYFGDSFPAKMSGLIDNYTTVQNFFLNANGVSLGTFNRTNPLGLNGREFGQHTTAGVLGAKMWRKYRYYPRTLSACYGGRGWASAAHSGGVWTQFAQTQIDALIKFDPHIIIAAGSLNDINASFPQHETIVDDQKSILTQFINYCPSLQRILFLETPSWEGFSTYAGSWKTECDLQRAAMRSGLSNWNQAVEFVPTYEQWVQHPNYVYFLGATNPDAVGVASVYNTDAHPWSRGLIQLAEIIWPYLDRLLSTRFYP